MTWVAARVDPHAHANEIHRHCVLMIITISVYVRPDLNLVAHPKLLRPGFTCSQLVVVSLNSMPACCLVEQSTAPHSRHGQFLRSGIGGQRFSATIHTHIRPCRFSSSARVLNSLQPLRPPRLPPCASNDERNEAAISLSANCRRRQGPRQVPSPCPCWNRRRAKYILQTKCGADSHQGRKVRAAVPPAHFPYFL